MAVHFLVLARHQSDDMSPVVGLVAVLIALVVGALSRLLKHDVETREPQARADLKRRMLSIAELRLIDFTSLPMPPASATSEQLRKIRVNIGTERGKQLQSLLRRLECSMKRRVPRIALSATLGDMGIAAEFLRPGEGSKVDRIASGASGQLMLLVSGYRISASVERDEAQDENGGEPNDGSARAIAKDLFNVLRRSNNLVFANSRNQVEKYTDLLTKISESERLPNEFWAHHGNLSKELREEAEAAVKDKSRPASAICTSTLELGIDIGAVKSIAQIGTPNSVASLRQRLGRSGRRGDAAILRVYIREREIDGKTLLEDCLRFELVQAIAMLSLLLGRWCEPPDASRLHLSTLVQQILSLIAQYGGVTARSAWPILSGTFKIDQQLFTAVLRSLGARRILRQEPDGTLLLDEVGEKIVNHYSFYAAFATPEEYRIVSGSKTLGTLPIYRPLEENGAIIFAGRRWQVVGIDERRKVIEVRPAPGGRAPAFGGERGDVRDRVRQEMRAVYCADAVPPYLEATARSLLGEARLHFSKHGMATRSIVGCGDETVFFTWMGDRVTDTVRLLLAHAGIIGQTEGPCIRVFAPEADTRAVLKMIASKPSPDPLLLAAEVKNKWSEKYDWALDEPLLNLEFASRKIDVLGALAVVHSATA